MASLPSFPSTSKPSSDLSSEAASGSPLAQSPLQIWVVNPFDQLPNESDVPLRYWSLCRTFAELGHQVVWWSSDFSHLTKSKRVACPPTDGFSIRLIETPPYTKNISWTRLKNHRQFAKGFYTEAMAALTSGSLKAPDRIIVSLPPLGVAGQAFKIRDFVKGTAVSKRSGELQPPSTQHSHHEWQLKQPLRHIKRSGELQPPSTQHSYHEWQLKQPLQHIKRSGELQPPSDPNTNKQSKTTAEARRYEKKTAPSSPVESGCQVIVDIMDAWPETFYRALPRPLRKSLGPRLLASMHRSAQRAYQGADKISAVGESYLNLAQRYLSASTEKPRKPNSSGALHSSAKPMHLCYHGTDLSRFQRNQCPISDDESEKQNQRPPSSHASLTTPQTSAKPLKAVYLGAMGSGYDLATIIEVATRWQTDGAFPFQIHFAGDGPQLEQLKEACKQSNLLSPPPSGLQPQVTNHASQRVIFHGQLGRDAVNQLLLSADLALVANRPGSLVACPYKAGEYAAAGLPMLSCLGGELGELIRKWQVGSEYKEDDADSLHAAFSKYSNNGNLLKQQSRQAQKMAKTLFDRKKTYLDFVKFIVQAHA